MKILDILNAPWAILPERYIEIREIYLRHTRGEAADFAAIEARIGKPLDNQHQGYTITEARVEGRGIAEIPMEGILAKRMNLFAEISGGTSTQLLGRDIRAAVADPKVHSLLLNIDSPGGEVDGAHELSRLIREARGPKPIVALADGTMASAAYWAGSAADEIYAIGETTQVGSIGVMTKHTDMSKAEEMRGLRITEITSGGQKGLASEHAPLDEESLAVIAEHVNQIYGVFVRDVAINRGRSVDEVLTNMAGGRIFIGDAATRAGLVDGIRTREQIINDLNGRIRARLGQQAMERAIQDRGNFLSGGQENANRRTQ